MCIKALGPVWWTFLQQMDWQTERQIDRQIKTDQYINPHVKETQTDRQTDSQPSVKCTDVVVSHEPLRSVRAKMATVCCVASIGKKLIQNNKFFFSSVNKGRRCYCCIMWWWKTGHTNKRNKVESRTLWGCWKFWKFIRLHQVKSNQMCGGI